MRGAQDGVHLGVVVHLELAIAVEAAPAPQDLPEEDVEAARQFRALGLQHSGAFPASPAMIGFGIVPLGLLPHVVDLERQDRQPVDDGTGRLGVQGRVARRPGALLQDRQELLVDPLDEVVPVLVERVDPAFGLGDPPVGGVGRARLVLVAAASYGALYVLLLTQALGGVPLPAPDGTAIMQWTAWAVATIAAAGIILVRGSHQSQQASTIRGTS